MITTEQLGHYLAAAFKHDGWGDIDPDAFHNPPRKNSTDEMAGLYEVLAKVTIQINKEILKDRRSHTELLQEELRQAQMDQANYLGKCGTCHTRNADMLTDNYCAVCHVNQLAVNKASTKPAAKKPAPRKNHKRRT